MSLDQSLQRRWYGSPGWLWLLLPLAWLYRSIAATRRALYRLRLLRSWRAPVPVIVIGNINVGGTGKTPLAIALCEVLQRAGFRPGIVSRGYGARPGSFPHIVSMDDSAAGSGDEPLLLARRTHCPVVIAPRRADAAQALLARYDCDVLLCDDGLQHYALRRDIEVAVIDAARGLGNGHSLPVGPLREPPSRLRSVDAVLWNGAVPGAVLPQLRGAATQHAFTLEPSALVSLDDAQSVPPRTWCRQHPRVHAVAGIGNPARFFATLRELGCEVIEHAFPDHHVFTAADLLFDDALPVVMTEKDAVKCDALELPRHWFLQVRAVLPQSLGAAIVDKLRALQG